MKTNSIDPFAFAPIEENPLFFDACTHYDNISAALTAASDTNGVPVAEQHAVEAAFSESIELTKAVINAHVAAQIAACLKHNRLEALPDPPRFAKFIAQHYDRIAEQLAQPAVQENEPLRRAVQSVADEIEKETRSVFAVAILAEKEGQSPGFIDARYDEANAAWVIARREIGEALEQVAATFEKKFAAEKACSDLDNANAPEQAAA